MSNNRRKMCFRGCTCDLCIEQRARDRRYRAAQDWRAFKSQTSRGRRLRRYGLTEEQLRELELKQGGMCAVCQRPESVIDPRKGETKELAVDHCHETGRIRGLLCNNCNRAIGLLGDSVELLLKAVEYLKGGD